MSGGRGRLGAAAVVLIGVVFAGCSVKDAASGSPPAGASASYWPTASPVEEQVRLHEQANAALARWADAVQAAGVDAVMRPVGEMTGQVGEWEEAVGGNNKQALMAGLVEAAIALPSAAPADGTIEWADGTKSPTAVLSAAEALGDLVAEASGDCPDCRPLKVSSARPTTIPLATSRGEARVPAWEFGLEGTSVRVTRVAVANRVKVVPPPWNPYNPPVGLSVEHATGSPESRDLTVTFVGAPDGADKICGEDYRAEAVESDLAVVVIVNVARYAGPFPTGNWGCADVGATRTAQLQLATPLGNRAVLEVKEGLPVVVKRP